MKDRRVKARYGIVLDHEENLEKDDICTVEDVVENWVILRREADGSSRMVDRVAFERGFDALE